MKELDHGHLALLVAQTKDGDAAAFSELYALTYNKVYNYAYHYFRDMHLAQDAVQEIYILVYKKINTLKDPYVFIAWLNQISFHVCYDMAKKRNSNYGVVDDEFFLSFCDENPASNPELQAETQDERQRLRNIIDSLPYLQRSVVILRYYNDMPLTEIATTMEISLSSVKRYLNVAKDTIRTAMSD